MIRTSPLAAFDHSLRTESADRSRSRPRLGPQAPVLCIACNARPVRSFRLSNGADLLRCPRCLLGWWNWPAFDPREFYDASYFQSDTQAKGYDDYAALEPAIRLTAVERLTTIDAVLEREHRYTAIDDLRALGVRRSVPKPAFVPAHHRRARVPRGATEPFMLDIGCGTGVFLDESRYRGWRPHGLEASAYAVQRARSRGLAVRQVAIEGVELPRSAFDCITMWDVIEHLRDPIGVIAESASALRPGGLLALSTGDISSLCARLSGPRWHLFNLPEHLFFHTPRSLRLLLMRAGLRVVSVRREVSWYTADYLVERLVKSLFRRSWRAGAFRSWLRHFPIPATLADIVSVYAVKPE